ICGFLLLTFVLLSETSILGAGLRKDAFSRNLGSFLFYFHDDLRERLHLGSEARGGQTGPSTLSLHWLALGGRCGSGVGNRSLLELDKRRRRIRFQLLLSTGILLNRLLPLALICRLGCGQRPGHFRLFLKVFENLL